MKGDKLMGNAILVGNTDAVGDSLLTFLDKTVTSSLFISDGTYESYPYKVEIECIGVTADYIPTVNFNITEATSGNFSPIAVSDTNKVIIYATNVETEDFIIPSIVCVKGGVIG